MKQQQPFRGLGLILVLVVMLIIASMFPRQNEKITNQEYMKAIENGDVVSATVKQNQQTPTGQVLLVTSDGSVKQVNVPDVIAAQEPVSYTHLKVEVLDVAETVKKDEAKELYRYI